MINPWSHIRSALILSSALYSPQHVSPALVFLDLHLWLHLLPPERLYMVLFFNSLYSLICLLMSVGSWTNLLFHFDISKLSLFYLLSVFSRDLSILLKFSNGQLFVSLIFSVIFLFSIHSFILLIIFFFLSMCFAFILLFLLSVSSVGNLNYWFDTFLFSNVFISYHQFPTLCCFWWVRQILMCCIFIKLKKSFFLENSFWLIT